MKLIKILSPAKINLSLQILQKRKDGYHDINTIFYKIPFFDELIIEDAGNTQIICNPELNIKTEDNIIFKAINLIKEKFGIANNVKVILNKSIPMGGGLGGGSSNAASTILALCKLWNINIETNELINLGLKLGSDVPFFLTQFKGAIGKGRGEILEELNLNFDYYLLLVLPNIHISTKEAYSLVNLKEDIKEISFKELLEKKLPLKTILFNDFEKEIFLKYPELNEIKELLYENQADYSGMSGSGSSMFGLFKTPELVNNAINTLEEYKSKNIDFSIQTYSIKLE